jgi:hypothetical protein
MDVTVDARYVVYIYIIVFIIYLLLKNKESSVTNLLTLV